MGVNNMEMLKNNHYGILTKDMVDNNMCVLIGTISSIRKTKGLIESFHIDVPRFPADNLIDSPIVVVPPELSRNITEHLKVGQHVHVNSTIQTVVKGGYGTVTTIVAYAVII